MKYLTAFCAMAAALMISACALKSGNDPDVESFKATGGKVNITCIAHSTLAITYKKYLIMVDPIENFRGNDLDYSSFRKPDIILVTHEHSDHYNPSTINKLSKESTRIITTPKVHEMLGEGEIMENGDIVEVGNGITIEATPAYNITPNRVKYHPMGNGNGYLLTIGGLRIFLSGDSEDIEEYAGLKDIDVAFLSANQPYTMTVNQCIHAAQVINPKVLIPYHMSDTSMDRIRKGLEGSGIDVRLHKSLR